MGNDKLEKLKKENGWTGLTPEQKEILKSHMGSISLPMNVDGIPDFTKHMRDRFILDLEYRDDIGEVISDKIAQVAHITCRCGEKMDDVLNTIQWGENGIDYTINNVPHFKCTRDGCKEEYIPSYVQLNVSILADKMRKGDISNNTEYVEF